MKSLGAPLTDEDMNEYRFQNESEIFNELAWTSIEPGIQVPLPLSAAKSAPNSRLYQKRLKWLVAGPWISVLNGIMKHISHRMAKFLFLANILMQSQLVRSLVNGNFFPEL